MAKNSQKVKPFSHVQTVSFQSMSLFGGIILCLTVLFLWKVESQFSDDILAHGAIGTQALFA